MKLEYLSYITMYVKCWNPFLCFSDFTSNIQQPMSKMRYSGIRVIRIGEGGGGKRSESCGRWVSPTLQ